MCYACDADKAFYTRGPLENRSHILNWSHSSSTLSFHAHHQCISFMAHQGLRAIVAFCAIQCFTANIKLMHWRRSGWSKTIGQSSPTLLCCKGFQYFSMFSSIMFCNVYHYYAMSLFRDVAQKKNGKKGEFWPMQSLVNCLQFTTFSISIISRVSEIIKIRINWTSCRKLFLNITQYHALPKKSIPFSTKQYHQFIYLNLCYVIMGFGKHMMQHIIATYL